MRLFFRAPAFFVLRAQKAGLRRRETEARGGRTFAYAHVARPSVPAARESAARPNGIFPQSKPAAGFVPNGNLL